MRIVLDSNVFCADYYLKGSSFQVFLKNLYLLPGTLHIPEVVIDEVVNEYRETLSELLDEEHKVKKRLGIVVPDFKEITAVKIDINGQAANFREFLVTTIKTHGEILDYPDIPHKKIVERDLSRRKPFKRDGSGYRDYLIWESIRKLRAWGTERIIFITNNPKDFGEGPLVDPDLRPDILNPQDVTLYRGVRDFNEALIIPRLHSLSSANIEAFGKEQTTIDFAQWLKANLLDLLYLEESLHDFAVGFPHSFGTVRPIEIDAFYDLRVVDAWEFESGEKFIRLSVGADIEYSFSADSTDFERHPEMREVFGEYSSSSFSMTFHAVTRIDIEIDLTVDKDMRKVKSHQLYSLGSPCVEKMILK